MIAAAPAFLLVFLCALPARAASGSAAFVSQSAALETSTVRGLLADISAEVRGPASSYTLTIDSTSGDDVKALLEGTRYDLIECYDLSLTAVNSQNITRNPQFGDATITIPLGSSMNPGKGTFAVYTINTDGTLQKIGCSVIYGSASAYAVKFVTIHFSTYAIVYTSGGSTRVSGSRRNAVSTSGLTSITNNDNTNAANGASSGTNNSGAENSGSGSSAENIAGSASGNTAASSDTTTETAAATAATSISASANGKDENGKDPYYENPKTGDRRYYGRITTAIIIVSVLLILIARSKKRVH